MLHTLQSHSSAILSSLVRRLSISSLVGLACNDLQAFIQFLHLFPHISSCEAYLYQTLFITDSVFMAVSGTNALGSTGCSGSPFSCFHSQPRTGLPESLICFCDFAFASFDPLEIPL